MILTLEMWEYFCEKQKVLDAAFMDKAKWNPTLSDRKLAYMVEKAEFVNEFPEQVKWWKHKENDGERMLDEFGDMIHFIAGYSNDKVGEPIGLEALVQRINSADKKGEYARIRRAYSKQIDKWEELNTRELLKRLVKMKGMYKSFALALYILETLGVSSDDIKIAYNQKNLENFRRIDEGY